MKANELMIGDWVLYQGEPKQITSISPDVEVTFKETLKKYDVSECEPIPITKEILERNGFKSTEDKEYYEHKALYSYRIYGNKKTGYFIEDHFLAKCSYVHELQHLFKLCKININLKL